MKKYSKILALDFEMFNAFYYWSICWIGAALSGGDMNAVYFLDRKVNPGVKRQLTGGSLTFPFKYSDLKKCPKFDKCCGELFRLLTPDTLVLGHAVDNDVKMLLTACSKYKIDCPDFDFLDTNAVYGAVKNQYGQIGLAALAEEYGVTFSAHNPVEDAAATLKVLQCILKKEGLSLTEAAGKYGFETGAVRNSLVRKCTADCMGVKAKEHIDNYNAVFDTALSCEKRTSGALKGKRVMLDNKLMSGQNLTPLVEFIYGSGGKIVFDALSADFTVSCEIREGQSNFYSLREFAAAFGLPAIAAENLDFLPNKVTAADKEIISYTEYLRRKYKPKTEPRGRSYSFVHALEKRMDFEDTAKSLLAAGGKLSGLMSERAVLVTDSLERIKTDNSDMKVRAYHQLKRVGKGKIVTIDELKARIERGTL